MELKTLKYVEFRYIEVESVEFTLGKKDVQAVNNKSPNRPKADDTMSESCKNDVSEPMPSRSTENSYFTGTVVI